MALSARRRREVYERAAGCCEYCRRTVRVRLVPFEVDHIVPLKHGGDDIEQNLCLACEPCNRYKGANVAAIDPLSDELTRLYNPRQQTWSEHFTIHPDGSLSGNSPEGRATVLVLRLNEAPRIEQRYGERLLGDYPCQKNS